MKEHLPVQVSNLEATIPDGIPVQWRGQEFRSGPLRASLDSGSATSGGELHYLRRRAELRFHVKLEFPEFAGMLADLGVDPALAAPVRATIHSTGDILEDHSFTLDGPCDVHPHGLFADPAARPEARMLPGT